MTKRTPLAQPRTDPWQPDVLGAGYEQRRIPLGDDPDGEGTVEATLVRYTGSPAADAGSDDPTPATSGTADAASDPGDAASRATVPGTDAPTAAVLYVHGFTDYFFQQHLAEHMAAQSHRFYALDLRKCGRSRLPGQTPHYVSDLALYDAELNEALRIVREETGLPVLVMAHSTGGLVASLWLDRLRRAEGTAGVTGLVLNSPWFDLQGPSYYRTIGTPLIDGLGRLRAMTRMPGAELTTYGDSLHQSVAGEWDYNLDWKPLTGFPVHFGWLRAIRRGHARLQRGLDIGVPALILRSKVTRFMRAYGPAADVADVVLDVRQIQRWSGCLGGRTNIVPIEGARHDVFLSSAPVRTQAFGELDSWLRWLAQRQD